MLAVISPAKSLDFETKPTTRKASTPAFLDDAAVLIEDLVKLAPGEVSDLMGISTKLGELNCNRYNEWRKATRGGKQAALAFTRRRLHGPRCLGLSMPANSPRCSAGCAFCRASTAC